MNKNYNIALDIETKSVGWAVIDDNYNLIKFKKANMWGVRLFEEGKSAKIRRLYRNSRRRLQRRKNRIVLLQNIMEPLVLEEDEIFFLRMKESFLHLEDRIDKKNKSNLLVGGNLDDKTYFKKYPTIYHLRKHLITTNEKVDIRLVYLAIHHIIKYRGSFLYEGQEFNEIFADGTAILTELFDTLAELEIVNINISSKLVKEVLCDKNLTKKAKIEKVQGLTNNLKEYREKIQQIFNGTLGEKFSLIKIFNLNMNEEESLKIKFEDKDIDEKLVSIQEILGEKYIIIDLMKKIYNFIQFGNLLNGEKSLSCAMVKSYNKYKKDLRILKDIIRENCYEDIYIEIFKDKEEKNINYENYVLDPTKEDKSKSMKERFYLRIKEILNNFEIKKEFMGQRNYILNEIEKETFLIKQNTVINSIIPYQLNEIELDMIIESQGRYYPLLKENKEKIIKLLTFRIPYYVGPLNKNSNFAWLEKNKGKEKEKIYPWNFDEVVNLSESAEKFIKRMTNKCSYLDEEDVIPKNSLLYSDYMFYGEINKIKVNNNYLNLKQKEKIRNEIFLTKNVVKEKDIIDWYKKNYSYKGDECKVEGLQGEGQAKSSLKPYRDFIKIFKEINENNYKLIEDIIYWLTIFEDKKIVKTKILENYDKKVNRQSLNEILKLKYKGWSRVSKKLLVGISVIYEDNKITIMDQLKNSNMSFMQIINDKELGFGKKINDIRMNKGIERVTYEELIADLQITPTIKRGVWQGIQLIEEIIKIMKCKPQKIFIEFTRNDEETTKNNSRKNKLIKTYEKILNNEDNLNMYGNELKQNMMKIIEILKDKNFKIDNMKQYLYFIQQGKCMYTGQSLSVDNLYLYEEEHIIPKELIEDDSIENLVLVNKTDDEENFQHRLPTYIATREAKLWWEYLYKYGLIGTEKYRNLTRKQDFSKFEEEIFINKQLVETGQVSVNVTNILNRYYGQYGIKVIAIKAQLVDGFRNQFKIYKNREINDYHHAKDAFITGIVGSYIYNRFSNLDSEFLYKELKKYKNENENKDNYGFIIGSMKYDYKNEDDKAIWDKDANIDKIRHQLKYIDCNVTKKVQINKGEMFNITIYKSSGKAKAEKKIPIKKNLDVLKYGYYTGSQDSYYVIISYLNNKEKVVKSLIGIPSRVSKVIGKSNKKLIEYLESEGYRNVEIIKSNIMKYQLFRNDKGLFYLAGEKEWHNAKQLIIDQEYESLLIKLKSKNLHDENKEIDDELIKFYNYFCNKLKLQYAIYEGIARMLEDKKDIFIKLSLKDKVEIVTELLKITSTNSQCANLKKIGATDRVGRIEKRSMDVDNTVFIYQSITGLLNKECKY